jgi:hypothetical protein
MVKRAPRTSEDWLEQDAAANDNPDTHSLSAVALAKVDAAI